MAMPTTAALIQDLINHLSDEGVNTSGFAEFDSVGDIEPLDTPNSIALLKSWHPGVAGPGSGLLVWRPDVPKRDHDGGTIFSPSVSFNGNIAEYLAGENEQDPDGQGVFVRYDLSETRPEFYGAQEFGDSYESLNAVLNSPHAPTQIRFGDETFSCSQTLNMKRQVSLVGNNKGIETGQRVNVKFAPDTLGLIVNRSNTYGHGLDDQNRGRADGSSIEGMFFSGSSGSNPEAHGIWLRARATIKNSFFRNFGGNGIHVLAASNGGPETLGNANCFMISEVSCKNNRGDGIYVRGYDANAGYIYGADCSLNGGWGIKDASFLGNTMSACHVASNGLPDRNKGEKSAFCNHNGNYYQTNPHADPALWHTTEPGTDDSVWMQCKRTHSIAWSPDLPEGTWREGGGYCTMGNNSRAAVLACYSEGGGGHTWLSQHSLAVGGMLDETPVIGAHIRGSFGRPNVRGISSDKTVNGRRVQVDVGVDAKSGTFLAFKSEDDTQSTGVWQLRKNGTGLDLRHSNLDHRVAIQFMGEGEKYPFTTVVKGLAIGRGLTVSYFGRNNKTTSMGTFYPTSGYYNIGDVELAARPLPGGYMGTVCTKAGEAGVDAEFRMWGKIEDSE